MNRIQKLITLRAEKVSALEAFSKSAADRGFTKEEVAQFDATEAEILALDADIAREKRVIALAASVPVTPSAPEKPAAPGTSVAAKKEISHADFQKLTPSERFAHVRSGGTVAIEI